jgi:hypothetical protein
VFHMQSRLIRFHPLCVFFSACRSVAATSAGQASAAVSGSSSGTKDGALEYEEVHSHIFDNELLAVQWLGGHILMLLTSKFEVRPRHLMLVVWCLVCSRVCHSVASVAFLFSLMHGSCVCDHDELLEYTVRRCACWMRTT